jgi:hypothetical protein
VTGVIDIKYDVYEIKGKRARKKCLFFPCLQHFSAVGELLSRTDRCLKTKNTCLERTQPTHNELRGQEEKAGGMKNEGEVFCFGRCAGLGVHRLFRQPGRN